MNGLHVHAFLSKYSLLKTDIYFSELIRGEKEFRKKMKARMKRMLQQMKAMESDLTLKKLAKLEEL